jgi:hypothetical protein
MLSPIALHIVRIGTDANFETPRIRSRQEVAVIAEASAEESRSDPDYL